MARAYGVPGEPRGGTDVPRAVTYSAEVSSGEGSMRRLLFVVLLLGGMLLVPTTAGASGNKKVTFTVGQLQDVDSLNVTVGVLVIDYEVWNLIWPTLTDMAAKDFSAQP